VPVTTALFLAVSSFATTAVLYEYNYEARMFYDKDKRAEYLEAEALEYELSLNEK